MQTGWYRDSNILHKWPESNGYDPKRDQWTIFVRVSYSSIGKIIENKIIGEIVHVKEKNIKKENVLKVLWNECITFKVLIFIIAYVVLAFINMPFEKWLSLYFEWEKLKDYQEVFMEEITLLVILPLMEIAAVALICFIIYEFFALSVRWLHLMK